MDTLINQIREQLDSDKIDGSIALMESELKNYSSNKEKAKFLTDFENKYDEQSELVEQEMNAEILMRAYKATQTPFQKTVKGRFFGWIDKKRKGYLKELRLEKEILNCSSIDDLELTQIEVKTEGRKYMLLEELGVIDFLDNKYKRQRNLRALSHILQPITGTSIETGRKLLEAIKKPNSNNAKNNPQTNENNKKWLEDTLEELGLYDYQ